MEGHAKVETFDYIGDDPATAPLLQQMRGADGKARVCDHVWISYFTGFACRERRAVPYPMKRLAQILSGLRPQTVGARKTP